MGVTGCFSFHEQKNMSTLGEGGMITTSAPEVFERITLVEQPSPRGREDEPLTGSTRRRV